MTRFPNFAFIILLGFSSCQQKHHQIKVKNTEGQLIKSYQIDSDSIKQNWEYNYDADGKVIDQSFYIDGKLDSIRTIFFTDGTKEIVESYRKGILHGAYHSYHPNGQIKFEANYDHNVLRGITKSYYEHGALKEEVSFENNEEHGAFIEYFENGKPKWKGQYFNGENEIGELRQYNQDGLLIKKLFCDSLHVCQTIWTLADGNI